MSLVLAPFGDLAGGEYTLNAQFKGNVYYLRLWDSVGWPYTIGELTPDKDNKITINFDVDSAKGQGNGMSLMLVTNSTDAQIAWSFSKMPDKSAGTSSASTSGGVKQPPPTGEQARLVSDHRFHPCFT